jgi:hypothetical protein
MGRTKEIRGLSKRNVARLAWRELKTTQDVHHLLNQVRRAVTEPASKFVNEELGFGSLLGPSIIATLQDLSEINRANQDSRFPRSRMSKRRERVTGKRARRAIHAILRSAS